MDMDLHVAAPAVTGITGTSRTPGRQRSRVCVYRRRVATSAWQKLGSGAYERHWASFEDQFGFRPGTSADTWPAIREPTPSVTIDLSPIFVADRAQFASAEHAVNSLTLRALTWAFPATERFVVMD
jgi:hypothetical protein